MLPIYLLVAAALLATAPAANAQDQVEQQTTQSDQGPPPQAERVAVPRGESPREVRGARSRSEQPAPVRSREATPQPPPQPQPSAPRVNASRPADDQQQAVPRGSRPRGDNPPIGQAVPRGEIQGPPPGSPGDRGGVRGRDRDRNIIVRRPPVYNNNYYYYPRNYYPYGYGGFGLGYFYYDPYSWYGRSYRSYGYGGYYGGPGFYSGVFRPRGYYGAYYDIGELRLRVSPRHAQVFVDGYYAGVVDDFDGILQSMKMESGPYHIEIIAPGYQTLEFDVRITPGQKINYRGDLIPIRP
jgi:hypothetical protein